jgi:DNA repair protein RadC
VAEGSLDIADTLIRRFGSLPAVFDAVRQPGHLRVPIEAVRWLALVADALQHSLLWRIPERVPVCDRAQLGDYLTFTQGHARAERVRVLYLDIKSRLLSDEVIAEGDLDSAPFSVREILDRAFALNAGAMVLVHNHPSGDPTPSKADIDLTRRLALVGRECGISLLDHILLARGASTSFRSMGLM